MNDLALFRRRLGAHRGLATLPERSVPLAEFRRAAATAGVHLAEPERRAAIEALRAPRPDATPVEGPFRRVAVCGGVYSNHVALAAFLALAERRRSDAVYCLGDLGGFGPFPERVRPLLDEGEVRVVQGNYEQSLASGAEDCACGYTDPRDNHFAALSYRYTAAKCSAGFRAWMGSLPPRRRARLGEAELLLVHGSPRRVNEFLFDSTTPDDFLELLLAVEGADVLVCTHTGLPWTRRLPSGRAAVNVGALGRPANDGRQAVRFAWLEADPEAPGGVAIEVVPLDYDTAALITGMRSEGLPEEFVATIASGWWTTCLEILPPRERASGRF